MFTTRYRMKKVVTITIEQMTAVVAIRTAFHSSFFLGAA